MPIKGFAATESTLEFANRFPQALKAGHFRLLPDFSLSSVGLGTYLGEMDDATDQASYQSLKTCLERGINVIDSAVNYRAQRSERVIGKVLGDLIQAGALKREEVFISTKGGFIPFDGIYPKDVNAYFEKTFLEPGILRAEDIVQGCHAMTPEYLEYSLGRSRFNLGLETIDLFYLHNPETQLEETGVDEFYARLRKAFEFLEKKVEEGKIRMYGTATWNGFRIHRDQKGYLSFEKVWKAAEEAGGKNHHFKAIQLPYNLGMPEAFTNQNQHADGAFISTIEWAIKKDILIFTSASLFQGRLAASLPQQIKTLFPGCPNGASAALQFVRSTPGVTSALVGMKSTVHVDENLTVANIPPLSPDAFATLFAGQG